jgi:hypothetical protein
VTLTLALLTIHVNNNGRRLQYLPYPNSIINYVYFQNYENICIAEVGLVNVRLEFMLGYYIELSTPRTTLPNVLMCENVRHSAANIRTHTAAQRPKLVVCTSTRNSTSP